MKRTALIGDGKKPVIRQAAEETRRWLEGRAEVVLVDLDEEAELKALDVDFAVVFGGDGFLLSVARRFRGNTVPVMGVNFGKLGFIAEYEYDRVKEDLEKVLLDRVRVSPRALLEVRPERVGAQAMLALNDVVIGQGDNPRMIFIAMTLDGEMELNYAGDGLIISTPTGSTAHSLSAGGPILTPEMEGVVLTPICPQAPTTRPLVIPASTRLTVKLVTDEMGGILTVDGQRCMDLRNGDVLHVACAPEAFNLLRDPERGFLDTLQDKLSWGVLPLYQERFGRGKGGKPGSPR